ncbi:MMS19 nucleotide excision repair protein, partial [Clarias magur]
DSFFFDGCHCAVWPPRSPRLSQDVLITASNLSNQDKRTNTLRHLNLQPAKT